MSEGSEGELEVKIKLKNILEDFNAPIKFDHAWAIIYMVSFCFNFFRKEILIESRKLYARNSGKFLQASKLKKSHAND